MEILSELTANHPNLPVCKLVYSVVSEGRLHLFLSAFDSTLAGEIRVRAKSGLYWSEAELWTHVVQLLTCLFQLHAMRVVHRSLSPNSIFLLRGEMHIGNFDDAKRVAKGSTDRLQTVRGCCGFLSPNSYNAVRSRETVPMTYDSAFRDDVWSLGASFLCMLSLQVMDTLANQFTLPQPQFDAYIHTVVGDRYSHELLTVVCAMLTIDDQRRPLAVDLLDSVREVTECGVCIECRVDTLFTTKVCTAGHKLCEPCLFTRLKNEVKNGDERGVCDCTESFQRENICVKSDRCKKVVAVVGFTQCPNCTIERHKAAKRVEGGWKAYRCMCPCGGIFCSYCGQSTAHSSANCPLFPDL